MTLIDPATSGDEGSGKIAGQASKAGTDFILVGGRTHLTRFIQHVHKIC
ncbi:MAG: hypothetical protein M1375_03095 [Candidatus Thermoplasmatota archaeon]|nr:hypothetical protein [Candidatus Thermoplasmatota archaeon]